MSFWYLQFSQKMNEKNWLYYYGTSSRIVFVRFLGEWKTPKIHFEINWPLVPSVLYMIEFKFSALAIAHIKNIPTMFTIFFKRRITSGKSQSWPRFWHQIKIFHSKNNLFHAKHLLLVQNYILVFLFINN